MRMLARPVTLKNPWLNLELAGVRMEHSHSMISCRVLTFHLHCCWEIPGTPPPLSCPHPHPTRATRPADRLYADRFLMARLQTRCFQCYQCLLTRSTLCSIAAASALIMPVPVSMLPNRLSPILQEMIWAPAAEEQGTAQHGTYFTTQHNAACPWCSYAVINTNVFLGHGAGCNTAPNIQVS
jgi:hypothetical protein